MVSQLWVGRHLRELRKRRATKDIWTEDKLYPTSACKWNWPNVQWKVQCYTRREWTHLWSVCKQLCWLWTIGLQEALHTNNIWNPLQRKSRTTNLVLKANLQISCPCHTFLVQYFGGWCHNKSWRIGKDNILLELRIFNEKNNHS